MTDDINGDHGQDNASQDDPGERVHVHTWGLRYESGTGGLLPPEILAGDAGGRAAWAGRRDDDATVGGSTPLR